MEAKATRRSHKQVRSILTADETLCSSIKTKKLLNRRADWTVPSISQINRNLSPTPPSQTPSSHGINSILPHILQTLTCHSLSLPSHKHRCRPHNPQETRPGVGGDAEVLSKAVYGTGDSEDCYCKSGDGEVIGRRGLCPQLRVTKPNLEATKPEAVNGAALTETKNVLSTTAKAAR